MGVQIQGDTGNVIATKGTYSGNVTIGGTLTYEDVTNIDSVGLITAREGIEVGARPGVAASISVDGNAIFSGITTIGGNVKVGTGVTLSPDGDVFATGVCTATSFSGAVSGTTGTFSGDVKTTAATVNVKSGTSINTNSDTSAHGALHKNTNSGEFAVVSGGTGGNNYLSFYTSASAAPTEKLRIGTSGQIGIAGANYGTDGQVLTSKGSSAAVQWASASSATSGTYTSFGTGNYVDITTTSTNIVKYDIMFTGVSCGGGTDWQFQLGDSGGIENSGYEVVACYRSHNTSNQTNNRSDGFRWHGTGSSGFIMDGKFSLTRIHNNKWFGEGQLVRTEAGSTLYDMWGTKELSGALTTIHISASSDDSEVFDGGHFKVIEYTGTV